jgi:hypothetical protein
MKHFQFLENIDFLGVKPSFVFKKRNLHQTLIGGYLSLLTALISLASIGYFLNILLSRTNYSVTMFESRNDFPFKNWTNEQISVILVDRFMNEITEWDRLFGYYADAWWNKPNIDPLTGRTFYKNEIKKVDLEQCNVTNHFQGEENLWRDQKLINSSICIKRNQDLPVQFLFGDQNFTSIVFWIHRCRNSTLKTNCFPKEKIEKDLENVFLQVRFKDYYVDHNDLNEPEKPYIYSDMVQASSTAYKRTWYYFSNVIYESDSALIFSETNTRYLNVFSGTRDGTDLRTSATIPGTFSVASFYNHPIKQTYKRKYYKIPNMMADTGGIVSGIMSLSRLIFYFTSWNLFFQDLINFNLHNYRPPLMINKKNPHSGNSPSLCPAKIQKITDSNEGRKFSLKEDFKLTGMKIARPIKLNCFQTCLPSFMFPSNKNSKNFIIYRNFLNDQIDMRNVINKLNLIDKLTYLIMGNYMDQLSNCHNPIFKNNNLKCQKEIMDIRIFKADIKKNLKDLLC